MRDEKCVNRVLLSAGLLMAAGLALQGCGGGGGGGEARCFEGGEGGGGG